MKIAALCPTWNQPELLGRMIECFNRQDYPNRELIILDDAYQYPHTEGDRWKLLSCRFRYQTLGDKRNALMAQISPDVAALAVWDDDDIYLPNHLSACVAALQDASWCQPRQVLVPANGKFRRMATFREDAPTHVGYHGGWAFRREAFEKLGGYASISNGEDQEIAARALEIFGPSADIGKPTYAYNTSGQHLSAMGSDGYAKLGKQRIEPIDHLDISWPTDYSKWPIEDEVLPRRW